LGNIEPLEEDFDSKNDLDEYDEGPFVRMQNVDDSDANDEEDPLPNLPKNDLDEYDEGPFVRMQNVDDPDSDDKEDPLPNLPTNDLDEYDKGSFVRMQNIDDPDSDDEEDPLSNFLDRIHKGEDSDPDADESSPPDLCARDYDAKKYRNDVNSKNKGEDSDPDDDESSPPDLCARDYHSEKHRNDVDSKTPPDLCARDYESKKHWNDVDSKIHLDGCESSIVHDDELQGRKGVEAAGAKDDEDPDGSDDENYPLPDLVVRENDSDSDSDDDVDGELRPKALGHPSEEAEASDDDVAPGNESSEDEANKRKEELNDEEDWRFLEPDTSSEAWEIVQDCSDAEIELDQHLSGLIDDATDSIDRFASLVMSGEEPSRQTKHVTANTCHKSSQLPEDGLPIDLEEVTREAREWKATKSDDAEVPEYLWLEHLFDDAPMALGLDRWSKTKKEALPKVLSKLRLLSLIRWRRSVIGDKVFLSMVTLSRQ
jgi:hypothetical protein